MRRFRMASAANTRSPAADSSIFSGTAETGSLGRDGEILRRGGVNQTHARAPRTQRPMQEYTDLQIIDIRGKREKITSIYLSIHKY